jgi:hypothetical protein
MSSTFYNASGYNEVVSGGLVKKREHKLLLQKHELLLNKIFKLCVN